MSYVKTERGTTSFETINFVLEICCNCGVPFMMGHGHNSFLRESHDTFYCPRGHPQSYIGPSEAQRLRKQLEEDQRQHAKELQDANNRMLDELNARKKAEKQLKRVHKGVCPCCNRTFINLQNHMKTKHPEVAPTVLLNPIHKKVNNRVNN